MGGCPHYILFTGYIRHTLTINKDGCDALLGCWSYAAMTNAAKGTLTYITITIIINTNSTTWPARPEVICGEGWRSDKL